jgi:subtilisin-like proprotein convertase family protein
VTAETAGGTWTLVIYDAYAQDTGTLSSWSITV